MVGRAGTVVICVLLLAAAVGGVTTVPAGRSATTDAVTDPPVSADRPAETGATGGAGTRADARAVPATDSTVTRIVVAANGSAAWEVQIRTRLENDAEVAEYEAFQERFRANRSQFLDPFRDRLRGVVADAENATGRPMAARDFRATTSVQSVPRLWGVVTYEFRWDGFAARQEGAVLVGDVFRGQFFLTTNDTLAVVGPDGYEVTGAQPAPGERSATAVRWAGRRSFPDDTPAVRFETVATDTAVATRAGSRTATGATVQSPGTGDGPGESPGTGGPGEGPGDGGTTEPGSEAGASGSPLPAAAAVLVVGIATIGAYRYFVGRDEGMRDGDTGDTPGGSGGATGDGADADQGGATESRGNPGADGEAGDESERSSAPDEAVPPGVDDDPLLTDADRVEQLLAAEDGRLRQSEIVDAFDWSKSKTSRVLSDMADEDRVEKLRIGRENVISLPDSADGADDVE